MYKQDTLTDEPKLFLDPNSLSEDGTISLATTTFSEDGSVFAYGLSKSGSDWFDVHFKNVETGRKSPFVCSCSSRKSNGRYSRLQERTTPTC